MTLFLMHSRPLRLRTRSSTGMVRRVRSAPAQARLVGSLHGLEPDQAEPTVNTSSFAQNELLCNCGPCSLVA